SVLGHVIGRLSLVPMDFVHGKHTGVLALGPARIGDVICFEIAYDGLVRKTVNAGGQVIVVQTNNATYARTPESAQQLAISRLRSYSSWTTPVPTAPAPWPISLQATMRVWPSSTGRPKKALARPTSTVSAGPSSATSTSSSRWTRTVPMPPRSCRGC